MAEGKPQLTEEEKVERKARIFQLISRVLIVLAVIIIAVFVYFMYGTTQNIEEQTSIDTQELRSKLKQIVALENRYHEENGEYVEFGYLEIATELPRYDPNIDGDFQYQFNAETGTAIGIERNDVNGDGDKRDGLTLTTEWNWGETEGSDFFWTEDDVNDFRQRREQMGLPPEPEE